MKSRMSGSSSATRLRRAMGPSVDPRGCCCPAVVRFWGGCERIVRPGVRRTSLGRPARAAAFATAYALLTLIGRATATEGQVVSLIWPGSGVALLWLLAESPRHVLRVLVPLMAIHFGVVLATGVSPLLGFFGAASVTLQTAVTGLLLRRWCPTMLGAGGTASIRSPRNLAAMAGAAAIGCALGAVIGTLGVWLDAAPVTVLTPVAWFARHIAGVLTVGAVGHLAWEWRTQTIPDRVHGGSRTEWVVLWVVSVTATVLLFVQPYPVVFLVIGFAVWSAASRSG